MANLTAIQRQTSTVCWKNTKKIRKCENHTCSTRTQLKIQQVYYGNEAFSSLQRGPKGPNISKKGNSMPEK